MSSGPCDKGIKKNSQEHKLCLGPPLWGSFPPVRTFVTALGWSNGREGSVTSTLMLSLRSKSELRDKAWKGKRT